MTDPQDVVAAALRRTPVVDGHNDLAMLLRATQGYAVEGFGTGLPALHTDLARLRAGGVGAQFWSVFVPSTLPEPEAVVATLEQVDAVHRLIETHPADLVLATGAADVRRAWAEGRIASLLGIEGGHSLATSLAVLRMFARLGVRYVTLTHNDNTTWADAATDEPGVGGLSDVGRAVVAELNRLGVLVDLSHVAASTMHAALDVTSAPVIFSHSSCRALAGHLRNVPDDVLARIPGNGGVVMVTFVPAFVSDEVAEWEAASAAEKRRLDPQHPDWPWPRAPYPGEDVTALAAEQTRAGAGWFAAPPGYEEWLAAHPRPEATIAQVADHVEHVREVAGVEHVGLGGDYDGTDRQPVGLEDVSGYPRLLLELAGRGWSQGDLEALTGGNILRVLGEVADPPPAPGSTT